jgi:hypothetical protein
MAISNGRLNQLTAVLDYLPKCREAPGILAGESCKVSTLLALTDGLR